MAVVGRRLGLSIPAHWEGTPVSLTFIRVPEFCHRFFSSLSCTPDGSCLSTKPYFNQNGSVLPFAAVATSLTTCTPPLWSQHGPDGTVLEALFSPLQLGAEEAPVSLWNSGQCTEQ